MLKICQHTRFVGAGLLMACVGFARIRANDPPGGYSEKVVPFLAKHCTSCHGEAKKKGDLILDRFKDEAAALAEPKVWQKVAERLRAREMPPRGRPQPSADEVGGVGAWLEHAAGDGPGKPVDPGRVTIRRLNRAEYQNTIRDLLGVHFEPQKTFPSDDVGYGFDNIGDVLSLPPLLMEKYLSAAEEIVEKAVGDGKPPRREFRRFEAEDMDCTAARHEKRGNKERLFTEGEVRTKLSILAAGTYAVSARCIADQAGKELVKMGFRVDGKDLHTVEVDAVEGSIKTYEARLPVEAGEHWIGVSFLNDFEAPADPEKKGSKPADRNLLVDWVEVDGPLDAKPMPAPGQEKIVPCSLAGAEGEACARRSLEAFATRAYRRPAEPDEVDRLVRLFRLAQTEGGLPEDGLRLALEAVLVSPNFLFRVELDPDSSSRDLVRPLTDYELATRLSYFLWQSLPDDELFSLARKGELRKGDNLKSQTLRLLHDPRARALTEGFADQWLTIRNLATVSPDRDRFPNFDDELRAAMRRETELFFEFIVKEDRSVLEFIDADYSFLNERLAKHYGISGVEGQELRRVTLPDRRRGGILTHASILTVTSNPTRTSPVKRGKWVLEQLLGTPPPPPPPNAGELKEAGPLSGTLRQRMEQHRQDPGCSSCHERMDPLGFGLENFDGVGAWRELDGGAPIDSSGVLPDGRTFNGPGELKAVLLKDEEAFVRNLAEKLLTFALGRGVEYYDRKTVEAIVAKARAQEERFSSLVLAVVESEPFQMRRGERKKP